MGPDSSLTPELIQAQAFTIGFRGYDQGEVRSFLNRVSNELRAWQERAEHLESAWHSAEERAARPPVLDEDTLMAAVGEETASILRSARSAAGDLRTKASEEAEKVLAEARAQAAKLHEDARLALDRANAAAEESASLIVGKARTEAEEILGRIRSEADDLRSKAEKDRLLTIEGANATRDRILEDLARRRRVATVQIEQLRAGRERLIESYAVVRRTLEEAQSELSRADTEARAAADEVGRRMRDDEDPDPTLAVEALAEEVPVPVPVVEVEVEAVAGPAPEPVEVETPAEETATAEQAGFGDSPLAGIVGSAVDELFARIRANQVDVEPPVPAEEETATETDTATETEAVSPVEAAVEGDQVEGDQVEGDQVESDDTVSDGDESLFQRRERAVVELETTLTRRLKRALQDEQNDVLDRLRNLRGEPSPAKLLPVGEEQVACYSAAAKPLLEQAAVAGLHFARSAAPGLGGAGSEQVEVDVEDLARDAGLGLVAPLRRRLEQAISVGSSDDQAVLVEALGAAYREWKTQRIERLAGDVLSAAFSRGTWEAVPKGSMLRWMVEDLDGPCPDCDDDALAGDVPKGEAFPTGQHHPPAHSGCRCLLVPLAAEDPSTGPDS